MVRTAGVKPATHDGPIVDESRPGDGSERLVASQLRHVGDVWVRLGCRRGSGGFPGTSNDPNIPDSGPRQWHTVGSTDVADLRTRAARGRESAKKTVSRRA